VRPTPVGTPLVRASDYDHEDVTGVHVPARRRGRLRRRVVSGIVATVALVPAVAMLPVVSGAPELGPARAWSVEAMGSVQRALFEVRHAWLALWNEERALERAAPAP
jgi:hypothetical protein